MLLLIVKSLSRVRLFVTPRTEASQTSLSVINSRSSLKVKSTESVMPSDHLILCRPLLFTSVFPNIRIFSNQSALTSGWPKYWGFTFSISPSNEYSGLISFRINCFISFLSKGLSRVFFSNTIQNHQFSGYHEVISFTLGKVVWARGGTQGSIPKLQLWFAWIHSVTELQIAFVMCFFTLSHTFASWKIIIIRHCFHHEDKNQLMIHLTVHDLSFPAVNCHSFCGHSTKPLHARTLKSVRQRQEIHGIFKDFRMISFVWWWEQKDWDKSRTRFYNSNSFICFWFQQRIGFSPKITTKYMFYFQFNL